MGLRQGRSKKLFPNTIIHKIFETNSSFHVKWHTMDEGQFLFFKRFFTSTDKIFHFGRRTEH